MRIITYNVNGVRSAINKGLLEWLSSNPADIVCLQEIKALKENVDLEDLEALGYHSYWFSAEKKGYSGVAIFSKIPADFVQYGNGIMQSDAEGRVMRIDIGDTTIINAYFPSGSSGELRQAYKYEWLDEFFEYIEHLKTERPNLIVCGDYNIVHKEIDIHDPKSNKNSSGFLPGERAWMDKWFAAGFTDTFRHVNTGADHYSWWSYRAGARSRNKGWRIDYISVSESLADRIVDAAIFPDVVHSDHCPVYVELSA